MTISKEERRAIAKRAVQKFAAERAPEIRAVLDTERIIERVRRPIPKDSTDGQEKGK